MRAGLKIVTNTLSFSGPKYIDQYQVIQLHRDENLSTKNTLNAARQRHIDFWCELIFR